MWANVKIWLSILLSVVSTCLHCGNGNTSKCISIEYIYIFMFHSTHCLCYHFPIVLKVIFITDIVCLCVDDGAGTEPCHAAGVDAHSGPRHEQPRGG